MHMNLLNIQPSQNPYWIVEQEHKGSHRLAESPLPPSGSSQNPEMGVTLKHRLAGLQSRQAVSGKFPETRLMEN